jgi:glycosyltransferase involved in cell wall biosynthesis
MPKVSVIITNYNHEKYLEKRIETVLAQTFTDYNVSIYDDCSTDNSREIIERYRDHPKVVSINYNRENSGSLYRQFEKAVNEATGEWIWKAESDDWAEPTLLEKLMALIEQYGSVGIAFCGSHWVDDNGLEGDDLSLYNEPFFRTGAEEIRKKLAMQCSIQNGSAAIVKTSLAKKAVIGISQYKACGDWIFYERVLYGSNIAFTAEKLNYFRWYHDNISNSARQDGTWIYEGIDVIKSIDLKKVKFSAGEFYRVIKWWLWLVSRSQIPDKRKMYRIIANIVLKYLIR